MTSKRKRSTPLFVVWSKAEQRKFIDAVERLIGTVSDLGVLLAEQRRRRRSPPQGLDLIRQAAEQLIRVPLQPNDLFDRAELVARIKELRAALGVGQPAV